VNGNRQVPPPALDPLDLSGVGVVGPSPYVFSSAFPARWFDYSLEGVVPSKKNSKRIFKVGGIGRRRTILAPSEAHEAWAAGAILQLKAQHKWIDFDGAFGCCLIGLSFLTSDLTIWDISSKVESVMDALTAAGVIVDDNRFVVRGSFQYWAQVPKGQEGVRIRIWELGLEWPTKGEK